MDVGTQLRPISLVSSLSKIAEEFVVSDFIKPSVIKSIDSNQFGVVPKSSTSIALINMIHTWAKETDGNEAMVRVLLFDYRKAFDMIDHSILVRKLQNLDLPSSIITWIADFLSNRYQRVKLSEDCFLQWGSVPSGVPQGTKLGPWLFAVLINDLVLQDHPLWKFVDDITASEVVSKGIESNAQSIVDQIGGWSTANHLQLNAKKCKELRIDFSKSTRELPLLTSNNEVLEILPSVKLLGLTISNNLKWNNHVTEIIKKAARRIYFLIQLKRGLWLKGMDER